MQTRNKAVLSIMVLALMAVSGNALSHDQISQKSTKQTPTTHAKHATEVKKAEGIWIDVRTLDEFNSGHLQGAVNIPHENIGNRISDFVKDKNAPINLYCRSGRRAEIAKTTLTNMGYTNVTNHGGYEDLVKKGLK
ncbi:periplasmic protein [Moraxella macacae 0408225]|uniref:Periplasmic protein n=1 Tax=Moraxella macacae 0408225 TaxID=1230338 RepID=L2F8U1_9GAMM|nr:rhodanese-like domain-containing protein [Moraxella macacae]ELA09457.1 periplasmic protein [Moraxella macacae 0408225]